MSWPLPVDYGTMALDPDELMTDAEVEDVLAEEDSLDEEPEEEKDFHPLWGWGTKSADGAFFTDANGVVHPIRGAEGYDSAIGDKPRAPKETANERVRNLLVTRPELDAHVRELRYRLQLLREGRYSNHSAEWYGRHTDQAEQAYKALRAAGLSHEEVVRGLLSGKDVKTGVGNVGILDRELAELHENPEHLTLDQHRQIAEDLNSEWVHEQARIKAEQDARDIADSQGAHLLGPASKFPAFARPELTAVQDLIKRDGALYPPKKQDVWPEHLAAVTAVGRAIQAESTKVADERARAVTAAQAREKEARAHMEVMFTRAWDGPAKDDQARKAWEESNAAVKEAEKATQAAILNQGQPNFDALARIRSMGTADDLKISRSTNATAKAIVLAAAKYYPKDWLDRAAATRKLEIGVKNSGRAFCSDNVVKVRSRDTEYARSTAVHEVGHYMENYGGRSIKASEYQFYLSRTNDAQEPLVRLRDVTKNSGYKPHEETRLDQFADSYMGKDYGTRPKSNYELLTMGMENLRNMKNNSPGTQPDYRAWLLGTLATA